MDIGILRTEITTDPLGRGYSSMTDLQVAQDMQLVNRSTSTITIAEMLKFLMLDNTYKTDAGDDTQARSIWQRMKEVAALSIPATGSTSDPWNGGNTITEMQMIRNQQLMNFLTISAQGNLNIDVTDTNFQNYLTGSQGAGCMSLAQKNAFIALVENTQSRGQELKIGKVREGNVQKARA